MKQAPRFISHLVSHDMNNVIVLRKHSQIIDGYDKNYWPCDPCYTPEDPRRKGRPGPDKEILFGVYVLVEIAQIKLRKSLMGACYEIGNLRKCAKKGYKGQDAIKHYYYRAKPEFEKLYNKPSISWVIKELAEAYDMPQAIDDDCCRNAFALYTEKSRQLEITNNDSGRIINTLILEHKTLALNGHTTENYFYTLSEQLSSSGVRLKSYESGQHKTQCPQCSHLRKARNRKKKCLAVKIDASGNTGVVYCHNDGCKWIQTFGFHKRKR